MTLVKTTPTALNKARTDYTKNFMPRSEICISLTVKEMEELLLSNELNESLTLAWKFRFYLRQLMLLSTAHMENMDQLKDMLSETHRQCNFYRGNGIKSLWTALTLRHFMAMTSDNTLCQIFDGISVQDDYCAQIAYEEYQRRGQHRRWQERNKK